jgi:WD40 repeat protein
VHTDAASFSQDDDNRAAVVDMEDGVNFRWARIGIDGLLQRARQVRVRCWSSRFGVLSANYTLLESLSERADSSVRYSIVADAVYWSDELPPRDAIPGGTDDLRFVLRYRTSLILDSPDSSCEVKRDLGRHRSGIGSIVFSPDGRYLAGAEGSGAIKLWETRSWESVTLQAARE